MNPMVDRVAAAIDPEAFMWGATEERKDMVRAWARRAIAAMRPVTLAMADAGATALIAGSDTAHTGALDVFDAMIDAALKDTP